MNPIYGVWCAGAFLLGGLPTAFLAAKMIRGIDIRQHGSGNVGATNAFRVLGKGPGSVVFAIDFLKGALPVFLFMRWDALLAAELFYPLGVGVAAILGHVFTPYLSFKGGKGIATGSGVLCAVFPKLFLGALLVWILCFVITRIVSISSIVSASSLVLFAILSHAEPRYLAFLSILLAFVLWTHRSNISRLMKGEEGGKVKRH